MKKIIYLTLSLTILLCCVHKGEKVERIIEDGVEVIVNHLKPYKIKGEANTLNLEEEFTIDTEKDEILKVGVTDIRDFDIDSEGNVYFFQERENDENLVYKFDKKGNFVTTFGKRGQGPGEIQFPRYMNITNKDEIPIQDHNSPRFFIFDGNGTLFKEIRLGSERNFVFYPLENYNYLKYGLYFDPATRHIIDILQLYNSKFEKLKELDRCDYGPIFPVVPKKEGTPRVFICKVSNGKIYIGHENRGYEILIYDLEGNLIKKVRKEYTPANVPDEFKENWFINIGRWKDRLVFPDKMPPFHYFFLDDEGRLYVKTYEKGDKLNEYLHDIFNSDGIFITRKSLAGYGRWIYPGNTLDRTKAKNNRIYCIREKENGYKELVVYKMRWE
jgi:hypothetical protein